MRVGNIAFPEVTHLVCMVFPLWHFFSLTYKEHMQPASLKCSYFSTVEENVSISKIKWVGFKFIVKHYLISVAGI